MTDLTGTRKKRDGTADLLKGFAVLFMMQVHLMEQFVSPDTSASLIGKVSMFLGGPPCAPVFLAAMGYFLVSSSKPLIYFLKRGLLLFLGGILLNIARSANLLVQIMNGTIVLDPWFFILGADILTLAGLSLVMTGLLRMIFKSKAWLYFLTALGVAAMGPFSGNIGSHGTGAAYIIAFLWGNAAWSYFPVFPWFAYVLAGYAFRLFLIKVPPAKKPDVQKQPGYFIPLWIGVMITIPYAARVSQNLEGIGGYYHHGILFFGWIVLFLLSYLTWMKLVDNAYGDHRFFRIIKWIGEKVTTLYVIQWLIIGNLATWLFRTQDLFQFAAWYIFITLTTLALGLLVDKFRKVVRPAGSSGMS